MEEPTDWWRYVQLLMEVQNVPSNAAVAEAIGVAKSTPGLWARGAQPNLEAVHAIANYFRRPLAEVFIKAGYATAEQLAYSAPPIADSRTLKNAELLDIIRERLLPDDALELAEPTPLRATDSDQDATPSGRGRRPRKTPMAREKND
ncbi:hypothetical protein [Nocardia niwae]|uniref:hypothetical protein n=1 Tax=Nocardia niwae TaxID=626084 RepID=UPI0012F48F8F|nr:hypothetical protein [Nocardia niwae]